MSKISYCKCAICGRALKDPVSIAIGVGPVCRMRAKNESIGQRSIFDSVASYDWGVIGNVVWIIDLDKGRSVTNEIDRVLAEINAAEPLEGKKVIYRDTGGVWDGVRFDVGQHGQRDVILRIRIYSLGGLQDKAAALERVNNSIKKPAKKDEAIS